MLRYLTAGESHGKAITAILEGMPAGLKITVSGIQKDLDKRQGGMGRGERGKIEKDKVEILSGVRFGKTLGSPISLLVPNLDNKNWEKQMSQEDIKPADKRSFQITTPRPGHADLPGMQKYNFKDARNVLERASARETVIRVAVGAICRKFLSEFGIRIASHTVQIGKIALLKKMIPFSEIENVYKHDPVIRCVDKKTSEKMSREIKKALENKDTLGGVVEVRATGVPVGLGSYVHWDRKLDACLAKSIMSINSVKAIEVGEGIKCASEFGSKVHDSININHSSRHTQIKRATNNAGGIEGGMSNGEDIVIKVYHKPISTLVKPLNTIDMKTKKEALAHIERSDICVIPRAGIISEAVVAFELVKAFLVKFGNDSLSEIKRNYKSYQDSLLHLT